MRPPPESGFAFIPGLDRRHRTAEVIVEPSAASFVHHHRRIYP